MQKPMDITYGMLAGANKRFMNFVIDRLMVTLLQLGLAETGNRLYDSYGNKGFLVGPPDIMNIKYGLLGLGITIVYYGLFESLNARTIGKYITNTMVVNRDGTKPDNGRIFLRTLCRLIPLEALSFIGRLPVGLHDNLSKTLVVDIREFKRAQHEKQLRDIGDNE